MKPLMELDILNKNEINNLFSDLELIVILNNQLLAELKERIFGNNTLQKVIFS